MKNYVNYRGMVIPLAQYKEMLKEQRNVKY